ncbi:sigma-70 family RNA polymerase sigma factor [Plantactinospora sp. DSM 117369]
MADDHDSAAVDVRSDLQLIRAVRAGDTDAYATLYSRHEAAARRLARTLDHRPSEVDELVAEAFTRVLAVLRDGLGPSAAFRTYLLTTVRNVFYDEARRARRIELVDDVARHDAGEPFTDPAVRNLEQAMVARAFAALPERWRLVLWHTEVEGDPPSTVARLLGVRPNTISALAYRARERLRQNYLREHAAARTDDTCRWVAERLGAYVRSGLSRRETADVESHLAGCRACHLLFVELGDINAGLGAVLAPAVVGTTAAGGYLSAGTAAPGAVWNRVRRVARRRVTQLVAAGLVLAAVAAVALTLTGNPGPVAGPEQPAPVPPTGPQDPGQTSEPTPGPPGPTEPGTVGGQPPGGSGVAGAADGGPPGAAGPARPGALAVALAPVGTLVRGRSAVLAMTVTNQAGANGGGGRLPGTFRAGLAAATGPLSTRLTLPSGIRLRAGAAGDGWTCTAGTSGTCRRGPLGPASSSTAYLPVTVAGTARGGAVRITLDTPGLPTHTASAQLTVAGTGLSAVFAGTVPARLTTAGNSLLSCPDLDLTCRAARSGRPALGRVDNGHYLMTRYSAPGAPAGAPGGGMVSAATVRLTGRVLWAGLYWAGTGHSPASPTAYVRAPGGTRYTPVRASRVDDFPTTLEGRRGYQAFADVTRLARSAGSGTWWVGLHRGAFLGGIGAFGGWSLVAVVADGGPARAVAVLDGALALQRSGSVAVPLPGAPGADAQIGFVGWETDRASVGDRLDINASPVDRKNPNNTAASRADGTAAGWNTFGTDARVLQTRLPSDRPAVVTARTGRDAWLLGALAISAKAPAG